MNHVDPMMDIDGMHISNYGKLFTRYNQKSIKSATPLGVCTLLSYYNIPTSGKRVVIIGKGKLSGKPLSEMLQAHPFNATVVNCDIFTEDVHEYAATADLLISACGVPNFVQRDFVKPGATLIDIGINRSRENKTTSEWVYRLSGRWNIPPAFLLLLM
jgi:methylenetetrahydrofolate dehydrogenase (NADP+)/methenyltetrahydrofolate cyclohydrolase